jgi:hypothetical protein
MLGHTVAAGMVLLMGALGFQDAPASDPAALEAAKKVTEAGAKMFAVKDAAGLAGTYADGAQLTLYTRDNPGAAFRRETKSGYAEILKIYEDMFKDTNAFQAKNIVEHARFLGEDMLLITGTFELSSGGNTGRYPFVQVRVKQGEAWKIMALDLFTEGGSQ